MVQLANILQDLDINLDPRTLLYIFVGLACLSLVSLGAIMISGPKRKKIKPPKNPISREGVIQTREELRIKRLQEAKDLPKGKRKTRFIEEVDEELEEEYAPIKIDDEPEPDFEPLEDIPAPKSKKRAKVELDYGISEDELNSEKEEPEIDEEELEEVKEVKEEPPAKPQIFSSVYLEPAGMETELPKIAKKEPEPEEELELILEEIEEVPKVKAKPIIEEVEEPELDEEELEEVPKVKEKPKFDPEEIEEEDIIQKPEVKIYPNIYEELQSHREDEEAHDMSDPFKTERNQSGKVIPSSKAKEPIHHLDDEDMTKEIILTPAILKERIARINKLTNEKAAAKSKEPTNSKKEAVDELDRILKQMGLKKDEEDEPELEPRAGRRL